MSRELAVLISDVHFNVNSVQLAANALKQALDYAYESSIPLIIAGDLNDTKAIIRAECANAIIEVLMSQPSVRKIVMVGNHDLINEKGKEHSLNFLAPFCEVMDTPRFDSDTGLWLIPYQTDSEELRRLVEDTIRPQIDSKFGKTLIMHQGLKGAFMGEYVIDKTSIEPEVFQGLRVVSGHYHRAQDIPCGAKGLWSYIGTPFSITAAEANDGPKGFRVLNSDGTLDFVPTNLRKHVTVERTIDTVLDPVPGLNPGDVLWLKVEGPATELQKLSKKVVGMALLGHQNFKLDKIYREVQALEANVEKLSDEEIFDQVIEESDEPRTQKKFLKQLWREILE